MSVRVGVLGASGYTACEAIRLLHRHPSAEVVLATSRAGGGRRVSDAHPSLRGVCDLELVEADPSRICEACDVVFSCLPHGASAAIVRPIADLGVRVVDLSADYRLGDAGVYEAWYGVAHPDPERLGRVPYGLCEFFRDQIRGASIVANPGCYPTAALLATLPLVRSGMLDASSLVIDAKSGISGAGRTLSEATHFVEANERVAAYKIGTHRHTPEIARVLELGGGASGGPAAFVPHLVPMTRGLLATCYGRVGEGVTEEDALVCLQDAYADEPFVRVVEAPSTRHVLHTNFCDVTVRRVGELLVAIGVIDNLGKGASSAAVQNMNAMLGLDETTGL